MAKLYFRYGAMGSSKTANAIMVRYNYLERGQIRNSVNMPDMPLGRNDGARLLIIHDNVPSMVSTIATVIGSRHINISGMTNKSRKEIAVTALDLDEMPSQDAIDEIVALPGVIRVRKFG